MFLLENISSHHRIKIKTNSHVRPVENFPWTAEVKKCVIYTAVHVCCHTDNTIKKGTDKSTSVDMSYMKIMRSGDLSRVKVMEKCRNF